MKSVIIKSLIFIAAFLVGMLANHFIITIGPSIIPNPEGVDNSSIEGIIKAMPLMELRHFITPFVAHALGTFVTAFMAYKLIPSLSPLFVLLIAGLFFIGGLMMVMLITSSPLWFIILDLSMAYFPMAWLGMKLAKSKS